ncbi:hypothetical protein [Capnocytophaga sp. oral taxon 380]|uniref:hypothetical protein n=1 Tax=Capnocytophaga sp. oral taxon 380 TaxID=712217 RepID=UPI0002A308FA|nr:hypothetical protein [Capnocytophaga sp. oral taxon 380]EKY05154.1 hypothetical protein HMPREF9078_01959 [Capnocytophaga sp. oral taxon 380 str. F0488]
MMDVFYYYIYLFYAKVMPDDYPHSNTVWALGFIFSLIINGLIDIPLAYFFNCYLSTIQKVIIIIIVMTLFYLKYDRSGKGIRIVKKEKPKFFGSNTASIILTILFFLIGMFFLFFKADIVRKMLEKGGVVAN